MKISFTFTLQSCLHRMAIEIFEPHKRERERDQHVVAARPSGRELVGRTKSRETKKNMERM